jgi:hypothetical protein
MNSAIRVYNVVTLALLPTVMFGGFSLLRLLGADRLNQFQRSMFRAGHAHAGVLLVLTMVIFEAMARAGVSVGWCWWIGAALIIGVLMQSGGMFIHMAIGGSGGWTKGNTLTTVGAVILSVTLLTVAFQIATA